MRAADVEQLKPLKRTDPFESLSDVWEFFRACDALEGPCVSRTGQSTCA